MTLDLAAIKDVSVFEPHVGTNFRIEVDADNVLDAELIEAVPVPTAGLPSEDRVAFSLLFKTNQTLAQRMYPMEHDELGDMVLFLTPIAPETMEAVFR